MALITEGSYPFTFGGVSTWCDQLVAGMNRTQFEVVAITGRRGNRLLWELPPNVTGVTELGFWEPKAPGQQARFVRAMGRGAPNEATVGQVAYLLELLMADLPDVDAFDELLDTLIEESRSLRLAPAFRSPRTVEMLAESWQHQGVLSPMSDVILVLDVLEHLLRTVSFPVPPADIYHAVSNGLAGLVAVAAAQASGGAVVLSEHGVYLRERYLEYLTGHVGPSARHLLLRFHRLLSVTLYRRVDLVVPVSRYNRRWEIRNGVEQSRIRVIHNGVDPARFPSADPERPPNGVPTIGFVARIDRIKDPLTLIRAAAAVRQHIPDVRVLLWGETAKGQDDYEEECREEVVQLGLEDAVSFEGRTSDPQAAYRSVDVVVMSSISEGLPYGVLEAMMSGCAIVATDVGGVAEALDGVGVLVEPGDHDALAAACVELLGDTARRRSLGWRARRRAVRHFTLRRMLMEYRAVYGEAERLIDLRERKNPIELGSVMAGRS